MEIINDNTSELCGACRTGDIEVVEEILNTRVININVVDTDVGDTALILAVRNGHLNVVKRLLQHPDVDVNAPGTRGLTPLMWAILWMDPIDNEDYGEYFDIVRTLLQVPSLQLGRCCDTGGTVLHYACQANLVYILKLICQDSRCNPALVNKKDNGGYTALMRGVCMGHLDIVKELDMEGTDYHTKNMYGTTLIEMARRRNKAEVFEYLMQRPNVDTLMVISAHNISRYLTTIDDLESLQIPVTVKQFLSRFVN